jgi:hypothetical protein
MIGKGWASEARWDSESLLWDFVVSFGWMDLLRVKFGGVYCHFPSCGSQGMVDCSEKKNNGDIPRDRVRGGEGRGRREDEWREDE